MNTFFNRIPFALLFVFFITFNLFASLEYQDLEITYEFFTVTEENLNDIYGELWVHLAWNAAQHEYVKYYYVYWNGGFSSWGDYCHRNIPMFKRWFPGHTRYEQMRSFEAAVEETLSQSHTFRVEGGTNMDNRYVFDEIVYEPKLKASEPIPPDNFTAFVQNTTLHWTTGDFTNSHNVYLGDSYDAVVNANEMDLDSIYRGKQHAEVYIVPDTLEFDQTYFWRIDEITKRGVLHKGDVWCFIATDYLTVDNFENYTDYFPNRIFDTWIDGYNNDTYAGNGTGAIVGFRDNPPYVELNITNSGNQSMPFFYNNDKPGCLNYSETSITWDKSRDLISEGVQVLSLWFRGANKTDDGFIEDLPDTFTINSYNGNNSSNNAEQLYIGIYNCNGKASVINHPDPKATQFNDWNEWRIPLVDFIKSDVTLVDIKGLFIGVGNRDNPQHGGSGMLYIDDIRLYEFQGEDPIDIINTGFETNQVNIETIISDWIGTPWELSSRAYSGDYSIESGDIDGNQSSGFRVIIDSSAGTFFNVSFAVKTSTEDMFDVLTFSANGVINAEFSGELDWTIYTFPVLVESEQLILEWIYTKDRSYSSGEDTVWLDNLMIQEL
ncbi:MAG: hypothetical protein JW715_12125 [Sedimentisphaerales bacterium]|nr:hypothetical protein [Sedimentisphaerales bacterium]